MMRPLRMLLAVTMVTACGGGGGPVLYSRDGAALGGSSGSGGSALGTGGSGSGTGGAVGGGGSAIGMGGAVGSGGLLVGTGGAIGSGGSVGGTGGAVSGTGGTGVGPGGATGRGGMAGAGGATTLGGSGGPGAGGAVDAAFDASRGSDGAAAASCPTGAPSVDVCGCGCCGEPLGRACYYPARGESSSTVDNPVPSPEQCATAGCSTGVRHLCCADPGSGPATGASYCYTRDRSASGGYRVVKTQGATCTTLDLTARPGAMFPISAPDGINASGASRGPCDLSQPAADAIGGLGTVGIDPSTSVIDLHAVVFFDGGAGTAVAERFDIDGLDRFCDQPSGTGGASGAGGAGGTGGSGGSTGTGGTASPCQAVLALDRSCTTATDCFAGAHVSNCCGQVQHIGFRTSESASFQTLETACDASYPACGCAAGQPTTDDGSRLRLDQQPGVTCLQGKCTTFIPDCGQPCAAGTTCFTCIGKPTNFAGCTTTCTDSTQCIDPALPKCQTGTSGNVAGTFCTTADIGCDMR